MLSKENYTSEYISTLQKKTGADPSIMERTVYAFGLTAVPKLSPIAPLFGQSSKVKPALLKYSVFHFFQCL